LLNQSIGLDPQFAEAYEALAYLYWMMADSRDAIETQRLVRAAATKAVELDPDLAFARIYARSTNLGPEYRKGTVEELDQAINEQPDNPQILEALTWLLVEMGYLEESLRLAEHYVQVDPLSSIAHSYLALGLYSVGRNEEAIEAAQFVLSSEPTFNINTLTIIGMLLAESNDETVFRYVESHLEDLSQSDTTWFRDLVTYGRDPVSGNSYIDRQISEIIATMSNLDSLLWDEELLALYLYFGFLDRYMELVLKTNPTDQTWHYAGIHAWRGTIFRQHGFTAHSDYVELARLLSIDKVWEHRGSPDFCRPHNGDWICE